MLYLTQSFQRVWVFLYLSFFSFLHFFIFIKRGVFLSFFFSSSRNRLIIKLQLRTFHTSLINVYFSLSFISSPTPSHSFVLSPCHVLIYFHHGLSFKRHCPCHKISGNFSYEKCCLRFSSTFEKRGFI